MIRIGTYVFIKPMNRKTPLIIISISLLIVLSALGWYFYSRTPSQPALVPTQGGLPFGQGGTGSPGTPLANPSTNGTGVGENGKPLARLFRISDAPAAGFLGFIKNGFTTIRYIERATGHVYDINPVTLEKTKITNNTLPKIYEAYFKSDGKNLIIRTLKEGSDTVDNTVLTLAPPIATTTDNLYTVSSAILRGDIGDMFVAEDNSLLYTTRDTGTVVRSSFNGDKPASLFSSPFTEWRLGSSGGGAFITTKASAGVQGYSYALKSGALSKVVGPLPALVTAYNKDGKRLAYSYGSGDSASFLTENLLTKAVSEITPATLAEKCTWSARNIDLLFCGVPVGGVGANDPDGWYQGKTHFSDRIWRFNTNTGFTDVLADPKKDFNIDLDLTNPVLTPDEDYLLFINKNDLTVWALKLN